MVMVMCLSLVTETWADTSTLVDNDNTNEPSTDMSAFDESAKPGGGPPDSSDDAASLEQAEKGAPPAEETAEESFEPYIDVAEQYYLKAEYQAARDAYRTAFELGAKPWVLFNVAKCSENLNQIKRAIAEYEDYIRLEKESEAYEHLINVAKKKIRTLPNRFAKLQIDDIPKGATLRINGIVISNFKDKMPLALDPVSHEIELFAPGHHPLKKQLNLTKGTQVFLTGTLAPLPPTGTIHVTCDAADSRIYVDERHIGRCPVKHEVTPGDHVLSVDGRDRREHQETFSIKRGEQRTFPVALRLIPWWIGGVISVSLGAVAVGMGAYSNAVYAANMKKIRKLNSLADDANQLADITHGGRVSYVPSKKSERLKTLRDEYQERNDNLDSDAVRIATLARRGMIIGYAVGGALLAVGLGFFYQNHRIKERAKEHAISVSPSGLQVVF